MRCTSATLVVGSWLNLHIAGVTVSEVAPTVEPDVALMVLVPTPAAVASPPAEIVAVVVVPDAHVTWPVRFCVLVSV